MARAGEGAGRKQSWEHPGTTMLGFVLPRPRWKHMLSFYSFVQTTLTITCLWMVQRWLFKILLKGKGGGCGIMKINKNFPLDLKVF